MELRSSIKSPANGTIMSNGYGGLRVSLPVHTILNNINNIKLFLNLLFSIIIAWAISLQFNPIKNTDWNYLFNTGYSLLFLFGGFIGIYSIYKFKIIGIPKNTLLSFHYLINVYGKYKVPYQGEVCRAFKRT
jgi:hypothetical protein